MSAPGPTAEYDAPIPLLAYAAPVRDGLHRLASALRFAAWIFTAASVLAVALWFTGTLRSPSHPAFTLVLPVTATACAIIASLTAPSGRVRRQAAAVLPFAVLLCFASPFSSRLEKTRCGSGPPKCAANLRQIGTSIIMYANDHRGALPPDWSTLLVVQELTTELFSCPSSNDETASGATPDEMLRNFKKPGRCSYVYVGTAPPTGLTRRFYVLAYEPLANHQGTGAHVLYADGEVVLHDGPRATRLIADLQAGISPPRP